MDDAQEKYEAVLKEKFQETYMRGMTAGLAACGQSVLKKLDDKSKSLMQRVRDVRKFCSVSAKSADKYKKLMNETEKTMNKLISSDTIPGDTGAEDTTNGERENVI